MMHVGFVFVVAAEDVDAVVVAIAAFAIIKIDVHFILFFVSFFLLSVSSLLS